MRKIAPAMRVRHRPQERAAHDGISRGRRHGQEGGNGDVEGQVTLSAASPSVTSPHTTVSRRRKERIQGDAARRRNTVRRPGACPATKCPAR